MRIETEIGDDPLEPYANNQPLATEIKSKYYSYGVDPWKLYLFNRP